MTIPDIKTWNENEKRLQIALMITSGIFFVHHPQEPLFHGAKPA